MVVSAETGDARFRAQLTGMLTTAADVGRPARRAMRVDPAEALRTE
jgi:hypothetical protein